LTGLNNPIGSCRHLYSKTISLVGMLANMNKQPNENLPLDAKLMKEDDEDSMDSEEMEKALKNTYSSTKPTMRR
jgi:hypothetical protein